MSAKVAYQKYIRHLWETSSIIEIGDIPLEDPDKWWTHPEGQSPEQIQARIKKVMKLYLEQK